MFSTNTLSIMYRNFKFLGGKGKIALAHTFFLLYRITSLVVIQGHYVPDEYWQSLEVAHNKVFGYGYLTWEWKYGLRSSFYPFLFAVVYKFMDIMYLDSTVFFFLVPRYLQAVLTYVSDHYFFLLCLNLNFDHYWAKMLIFTNWFWFYCGSRTIINSFETCLTTIALYYYPWDLFNKRMKRFQMFLQFLPPEVKKSSIYYLTLAAIICIVRPTALTIWGPLVLLQMKCMYPKFLKQFVFGCILPVVLVVLPVSLVLDYIWYGKFVIPPLNFLFFNIFEGVASFYGTHPFSWYIVQGLPVVLGLHYFPFIFGLISVLYDWFYKVEYKCKNIFLIITSVVIFNLVLLSCVPHKEFRFILPLTPLMMLLVGKVLTQSFTPERKRFRGLWSVSLILGFIVPTILFGSFHNLGPIGVTEYLRRSISKCNPNCFFLYLMPCHSTPLYSHIHVNVSTRIITCEPPIMGNQYDESANFFANPNDWLEKNWDDKKPPTHVTFFDVIQKSVTPFLTKKGFVEKSKFIHSVFAKTGSGRFVIVYEPS